MKKLIVILLFLSVSAGLLLMLPTALNAPEKREQPFLILRIWNADQEIAVQYWLRGQAKTYEKATGQRVYLRTAPNNRDQDLLPDALIIPEGDHLLALRGYALVVRADTAAVTPAPTSALFYRPSPAPEAAETPAPWPEEKELRAVLCPEALTDALPGTVLSTNPAADFAQGKADAALLTPGQAAGLAVGYRAFAIPEGKGFLPVRATAYTEAGEAFLSWLQGDEAQRALAQAGLFSPRLRLYGPDDPVRYVIECGYYSEN
ncbi:MAG: extracellular solute-binding protein [Clostridia bacterium]|nr:extracellular solute-binding protein [Clostridia bacterium]